MIKVGVSIGFLVVNRRADVIISNAKRDARRKESSLSEILCKLKSRMEVRYKVNIVFQFHAATTCDSDDGVDVSLVQLRYKALVVRRNFTAVTGSNNI